MLHRSSARRVATTSDIDLNQGGQYPWTVPTIRLITFNTYESMGLKLTIGNTSTQQIHSMCIPHRRTPTTAVFVYRQLLPDDS